MRDGSEMSADAGKNRELNHPDVIFCANGPMLLRGDHLAQDEDGNEHRTTRPVSAVCRCGGSQIKPWCDGTHKFMRQRSRD